MDLDYRNSEIEKINFEAKDVSDLKFLKRTYSIYEIAIMTRAAPAKILGLNDRGSLKPGHIADIAIYDPKKPIDEMFSYAEFVFKNGKKIIEEGKVTQVVKGSTQIVNLNYEKNIRKDIQKWFDKFYSLHLETFEVDEDYFEENNFKNIREF